MLIYSIPTTQNTKLQKSLVDKSNRIRTSCLPARPLLRLYLLSDYQESACRAPHRLSFRRHRLGPAVFHAVCAPATHIPGGAESLRPDGQVAARRQGPGFIRLRPAVGAGIAAGGRGVHEIRLRPRSQNHHHGAMASGSAAGGSSH